ncbi:nucleoside recognition domain-containing protein [Methanopyrus sp.]
MNVTRLIVHYLLVIAKVAPLVFLGFFLASLMVILRVHERLGKLMGRRLARLGLTPEAASAMAASLVSPSAGYPILAEFRREGRLDDRDVVLLVVATTFPTTVGETFLKGPFFAALAILGPKLGAEYMGALFVTALLQTLPALVLYGARSGNGSDVDLPPASRDDVPPLRKAAIEGLRRAARRMKYVLPRMIGVGLPMVILAEVFRSWIHGSLGPVVAITLANVSHYTVGYATAAELVHRGVLSESEAVAALLIAGCANVLVIFLKASLATYVSIFGSRLGLRAWAANLGSSVGARLLMAYVILRWS